MTDSPPWVEARMAEIIREFWEDAESDTHDAALRRLARAFALGGRSYLCVEPRAAHPATPRETLDAAWAEAEAALPEGWKPLIGREDGGWWATASGPRDEATRMVPIVSTSKDGSLHGDMAAALRWLAELIAREYAALPATPEDRGEAPVDVIGGLRIHKCQHGNGEPVHDTIDRATVLAILAGFVR